MRSIAVPPHRGTGAYLRSGASPVLPWKAAIWLIPQLRGQTQAGKKDTLALARLRTLFLTGGCVEPQP